MEETVILMKKYALKLVKQIQSSKKLIINSADYINLLIDFNAEIFEYVDSEPRKEFIISLRRDINFRISLIKQLLYIAQQAILLNDINFKEINIDLNNIILY